MRSAFMRSVTLLFGIATIVGTAFIFVAIACLCYFSMWWALLFPIPFAWFAVFEKLFEVSVEKGG